MVTKNMWGVAIIVLALGLMIGCDDDTLPKGDVYSYKVDDIAGGLFGNMSPTMTMNDWCLNVLWDRMTYDDWTNEEKVYLYKDKALKKRFKGSDILDENTVVYCDYSFNGQGKETGEITGTITLSSIPLPATTKVFINTYFYNGYPGNWWNLSRKIDMSSVTDTDTSATLNWSLPVYESLKSPSQASFSLIVLPGDSKIPYDVSIPTRKTIGGDNADVGDLGTVSIRGVTLSGTINVTLNGQPVPYVEIYANYAVEGTLGITCLSSPGPDAPWSVTFGRDFNNSSREVEFQIKGYSKQNWTADDILFDRYTSHKETVKNNESIPGIVINMGDI